MTTISSQTGGSSFGGVDGRDWFQNFTRGAPAAPAPMPSSLDAAAPWEEPAKPAPRPSGTKDQKPRSVKSPAPAKKATIGKALRVALGKRKKSGRKDKSASPSKRKRPAPRKTLKRLGVRKKAAKKKARR